MEITVTKENFETEVLQSTKPVLVDFWATWCGPCRMVAPILEEIATEYADRVIVGKVNVDDEPELATQFGIMSIPTIMLIQDGEVKETVVGFRPKEQLVALIP